MRHLGSKGEKSSSCVLVNGLECALVVLPTKCDARVPGGLKSRETAKKNVVDLDQVPSANAAA